ncbi:putative membrane protein [Clostridioides difficile CD46]|nr:putative membrane protein [Clostridioides difficile CD46]
MDGIASPSFSSSVNIASLICSLICWYNGLSDVLEMSTFIFYHPLFITFSVMLSYTHYTLRALFCQYKRCKILL